MAPLMYPPMKNGFRSIIRCTLSPVASYPTWLTVIAAALLRWMLGGVVLCMRQQVAQRDLRIEETPAALRAVHVQQRPVDVLAFGLCRLQLRLDPEQFSPHDNPAFSPRNSAASSATPLGLAITCSASLITGVKIHPCRARSLTSSQIHRLYWYARVRS